MDVVVELDVLVVWWVTLVDVETAEEVVDDELDESTTTVPFMNVCMLQ